jgi:hypothetical protein
VKTESADRRLRLNAAAFHYVYDDKQLVAYHALASGQEVISLFYAEGGTGYGGELDLDYRPIDTLRLSGSVGYVKTRIEGCAPRRISSPISKRALKKRATMRPSLLPRLVTLRAHVACRASRVTAASRVKVYIGR